MRKKFRYYTGTANKDYPEFGVKKGDVHYIWQVRGQKSHRSMTPPRPSQVTTCPFLKMIWEIEEDYQALLDPELLAALTPNKRRDRLVLGANALALRVHGSVEKYPMPDDTVKRARYERWGKGAIEWADKLKHDVEVKAEELDWTDLDAVEELCSFIVIDSDFMV